MKLFNVRKPGADVAAVKLPNNSDPSVVLLTTKGCVPWLLKLY